MPETVGFATKPQIARRMIAHAIAAKVPFGFVAADSVYGTGDIETTLRVPLLGQEAAYRSKVIAGPSKTASKPPRMNAALITMKPAPGMAGIAMCRSSCSSSP